MSAERVHVVGMQLQPPARNHERPWNPRRFQSQHARACVDRLVNSRPIHGQCSIGKPKQYSVLSYVVKYTRPFAIDKAPLCANEVT